jgi:2-amino-4-hydroxy-6-hydroxymethyldihydropteridine diphosphokinase
MAESGQLNRAYLSLGSNIDPERNLPEAVRRLNEYGRVTATSSVWQTAPVGMTDQADFLNAAVLLETPLSAQALREQAIARIERDLKRVRTENKNGPRTIDIDIVLFNRETLWVGRRRIPDPDLLERPFVAIPLAECAPQYIHPETGQTLQEIAGRFDPVGNEMRKREDVELREGGPLPWPAASSQ